MPIKITRASDPIKVSRINLCIYSAPGVGKTSLAFTADKPLLLDFDHGTHRAANRRDSVIVESWEDVASIKESDLAAYNTVVVDTAGRALDVLTADIIRRNPKLGRGGALTLQGYGALKSEFVAWLKHINSMGKDVLLIAHMDEQRSGDDIIERLDVQGGSKGEIYKAADAMGRLIISGGKRVLNFSPTDAAFGKNPGQFPPLEVPHPDIDNAFLAGVISQIKDKLNSLSEDQLKAQADIDNWRAMIAETRDADAVNKLVKDAHNAQPAVKALLHAHAISLGLTPNKSAGIYEQKSGGE